MINPRDPRTPYRQVADAIRDDIKSGTLGAGTKLPSTQDLATRWNVSTQTIQRAISSLKAQGLVEGSTGRGVFVRRQLPMVGVSSSYIAPDADGSWSTWASEAAKHGMEGKQRLLHVVVQPVPGDVADVFGDEREVVVRQRVMLLDGAPVQLVDSYYPRSLADGTPLAEPRKIPGGAPALLAELGHRPHDIVETVTARMPTPEEADQLSLAEGVPIIRIERTALSQDDRPIEVTIMTLAADRHRLLYRLPAH